MDRQEAKKILALFRPGTADEKDSSFLEARRLAGSDPELARWFDEHRESHLVLRQKFQSIPIPPGLKEQILSERKIHRPFFQRYARPLLAAAAAIILLVSLLFSAGVLHGRADRYAAYRKRMTEKALRSYSMDFVATDPVQIRNFLKGRQAPADYSLPAGLKTATMVGCVVSSWQSNPVSMICFKSGRPLPPGEQSDVWLFVVDRKAVAYAPSPPVFARVNKATTATWSDGGKTYLLAAVGDEAFLQKYLHGL